MDKIKFIFKGIMMSFLKGKKKLFCSLVVVFGSYWANGQLADSVLQADVCIYGATSGGIIAGYTVQNSGKAAMVIDPGTHIGGLSAGGLGFSDIGNKYVITGVARDFYRRIGKHYGKFEQWIFEPKVARQIFRDYINESSLPVLANYRLIQVVRSNGLLQTAVFENRITGRRLQVKARIFIDASYEGDLVAKAGVSYTVGRESNDTYGETYNGVQLRDKHQFPDGIDPYKVPGNPASGLLWGISGMPVEKDGTGDNKVQSYNFRICLTNDPANRVPVVQPAGYDTAKYELLLRVIAAKPNIGLKDLFSWDEIPNHKTDINNNGPFSTDMIGLNWHYPEADFATREKFKSDLESYTKGLLYFLGHDERVPAGIRTEILNWGYPKDEYEDNDHWSPQPYIRESRRMKGAYVMTEHNCVGKAVPEDGVAYAAYTMDSHNCDRVVVNRSGKAWVKNEGDVQVGGFPPYPISYHALTPKPGEVTNLLVPVCLSASHIAYGSIRMEPVFMVLGQVSGVAAVQAINTGKTVQDISVEELKQTLSRNPLTNGSLPEILTDNDRTPQWVQVKGPWQELKNGISQFGGSYGSSMLYLPEGNTDASVVFNAPIASSGKYRVLYYNPGSGSGKAAAVHITIRGTRQHQLTVNLEQQNSSDWVELGTYDFTAGKPAFVQVNGSEKGNVVADAVLWLPEKE